MTQEEHSKHLLPHQMQPQTEQRHPNKSQSKTELITQVAVLQKQTW